MLSLSALFDLTMGHGSCHVGLCLVFLILPCGTAAAVVVSVMYFLSYSVARKLPWWSLACLFDLTLWHGSCRGGLCLVFLILPCGTAAAVVVSVLSF